MNTQDCVFCKIVNGQIPTQKILDDDLVLAFHDVSPSAEVHILIAPKAHLAAFTDLSDLAVWNSLRQAAQRLIREMNLSGAYKLVFNGGSYQHVPHLHWHLLGGRMHAHP